MTTDFISTFSWLDSSESERKAVMELVSALNEPGTLDELGIGSIRDTIADVLFPGTSTIQTRARYFLFIPWILQMVEARPRANSDQLARQLQLQLCDALSKTHGAGEGVIGREARASLQRWPSSIYWVGLERWGIRREPGSIPYHQDARRGPSALLRAMSAADDPVEDRRYESAEGAPSRWAKLPLPPEDFPDNATFNLSPEEGRFLRDCVELKHPQSYLAHVLREANANDIWDADYPWNHTSATATPPALEAWLHDAELFSLVHLGAAYLYNLMQAEALEDDERCGSISTDLAGWFADIQDVRRNLEEWDRVAMWQRLRTANPRLRQATIAFADRWYSLVISMAQPPTDPGANTEARFRIRERELALKGLRARLTYPDALKAKPGYPSSGRLTFRWPQVQRIVADILEPLKVP